eukprot:comp22299_c0_seq1/m.53368 comp22299_c0_seq1/g.53368  ORF comp22299_c0_seq1/g.53368 comp22299_c0_seq1/m.53368 type:complete len:328 (-) comp22299_c0_seq1:499-1482(-)
MERRSDSPHGLVAADTGKAKGGHEGVECRRRGHGAKRKQRGETTRDQGCAAERLLSWKSHSALKLLGLELLRSEHLLDLLCRGSREGLGRRWRPEQLAVLEHEGAAHDFVLEIDDELALLGGHGGDNGGDVVRVECRRERWETRGQIGDTDVGHALVRVDFSRLGGLDVASGLGGEIDNNRAVLHRLDVLAQNELGRGSARNQRRGDDHIALAGLLGKERHLGLDELRGHLLGIAACTVAVLLEVKLEELGTEGLHLLLDGSARVKGTHDSTHCLGGDDGGKTSDTCANHKHLCRGHLSCGGHLAGKEAAEMVGGHDDGLVARRVGH